MKKILFLMLVLLLIVPLTVACTDGAIDEEKAQELLYDTGNEAITRLAADETTKQLLAETLSDILGEILSGETSTLATLAQAEVAKAQMESDITEKDIQITTLQNQVSVFPSQLQEATMDLKEENAVLKAQIANMEGNAEFAEQAGLKDIVDNLLPQYRETINGLNAEIAKYIEHFGPLPME